MIDSDVAASAGNDDDDDDDDQNHYFNCRTTSFGYIFTKATLTASPHCPKEQHLQVEEVLEFNE